MADRKDGAVDSIESSVLVKDLTDAQTNPNVPRSVFATELPDATINDDGYTSVVDGQSKPGKGWSSKSISAKARKMKGPFDANGVSGNDGDWLVYWNGHYHVVKERDL